MVMLSTMMLPYAVTMIPQYFIYGKLGWHDTYLPLLSLIHICGSGGGACSPVHQLVKKTFLTS